MSMILDPSWDLLVHCLLDNACGYIRHDVHLTSYAISPAAA